MTIVATDKYTRKTQLDELNDQTARLMNFKKVHTFMGKLCIQIEGDVPNNNIPWSPSTNFEQALMIVKKYGFTLKVKYSGMGIDNVACIWSCSSDLFFEACDSDPLIAICKSLIEHAKLG